ncbi:MAG: hypothetical protein R6V19_14470 [Armatimonadota bacterium]
MVRCLIPCVVLLSLCIALPALAQPTDLPPWLKTLNPEPYFLFKADVKAPFKYGTDPVIRVIESGRAATVRQSIWTEYSNTVKTDPPTKLYWKLRWQMEVLICENADAAKASVAAHYIGGNEFTKPDENGLNDPRLNNGVGASASDGSVVRYGNAILRITGDGPVEIDKGRPTIRPTNDEWRRVVYDATWQQTLRMKQVAKLWIDKISSADCPDLSISEGLAERFVFSYFDSNPNMISEPRSDQQFISVRVDNKSTETDAKSVMLQMLVKRPGDREYSQAVSPVSVGDIPAGEDKRVSFLWDLKGENVDKASLRFNVTSASPMDANPADNTEELKVSIYFAKANGRAFGKEDWYSFKNYTFKGRETEELIENTLATVADVVTTEGNLAGVMQRMLFPQVYMRAQKFLELSAGSGAGGHCHGMAATSALYFEQPGLKPVAKSTNKMTKPEASANINLYHRRQLLPLLQSIATGRNFPRKQWNAEVAANAIRRSLKDHRRPCMIAFAGYDEIHMTAQGPNGPEARTVERGWQHALLAYKMVEVEGTWIDDGIFTHTAVYVYDSNLPACDLGDDDPMPAIGFQRDLFGFFEPLRSEYPMHYTDGLTVTPVNREMPVAEINALWPTLKKSFYDMVAFLNKSNKLVTTLRCPADVVFTDPSGRRTGTVKGSQVNEIPGAEIRATGEVEIYILPANVSYSVKITGTGSGKTDFDVITAPTKTKAAMTAFNDLPTSAGTPMTGTLGKDGAIAAIETGQKSYPPAYSATMEGNRIARKSGILPPTSTPQPQQPQQPRPQAQQPQRPTIPQVPTVPKPQPTPHPTPPSSSPTTGGLVVCEDVVNGQPVNPRTSFGTASKVACFWRYTGLAQGTELECTWYRDGQQQVSSKRTVGGNGWASFYIQSQGGSLGAGNWEVRLTVKGNTVASGKFTIARQPAAG